MSLPEPYYHDEKAGMTIYHGDCRDVLPHLEPVDLVLTDPPYGHNNNNNDLIHRREAALGQMKSVPDEWARPIANDGPEEAAALVKFIFAEAARLLKPGCCCCCCGGGGPDPQFARWALWLDEVMPFKHAVVWDKGGLGMGWHYRRNYELMLIAQKPGAACNWHGDHKVANVVRIPGIKPGANDHPTPKPVALMAHFMGLHSAAGEIVLDPLMGGGTTLRAAKDLNRRCIGIEIEEKYCEIAAKRLAQEVFAFQP